MASDNKRILVVGQHFWPETFRINDICDFLVEKDCEIDVLCGMPNYPQGHFFEGYSYFHNRKQRHNGVNIRRVFEVARGNNSDTRIFLNYVTFPIASLFHIPRLLTRKYDKILIYQTSPVMMALAGIIVGKLKRTETTMYVLDLWPENLFSVKNINSSFARGMAAIVSRWHYNHADKLVALSQKMASRLLEVTKKPPEQITILPQACEKIYETNIYDKDLAKKFKGKFNVLFTGNISPAQSFETIIAAAQQLQKAGVTGINWIIVGDGMSRKWLEAEVARAGLSDIFHFEGLKPMADIPKYTTIADVLLGCLVKSELLEATIPAKVMSYFAAGRPMVLAMDGEARELVNHTIKCGFAGPTGDSKTLANNIKKVYGLKPGERANLGERARAYHFKHFERNIILSRLYDFIFS
jgi:colanic acid biosynthesis glycosyl transferase WcaI